MTENWSKSQNAELLNLYSSQNKGA